MLKFPVKCVWAASRLGGSTARWLWFKLLEGSYFARLGRGTKFFGRVRFGSVEGNIFIGRGCMIGHEIFFSASRGACIRLGDGCMLNTGCHVVATKGIEIGEGTLIAEYCSIRDQNHRFDDLERPLRQQGFSGEPVVIGKEVWIGRGVFVGPGVTIGDGCIIGANSVVTRSVPPYSVAVGAPARVIRRRGEPKESGVAVAGV